MIHNGSRALAHAWNVARRTPPRLPRRRPGHLSAAGPMNWRTMKRRGAAACAATPGKAAPRRAAPGSAIPRVTAAGAIAAAGAKAARRAKAAAGAKARRKAAALRMMRCP